MIKVDIFDSDNKVIVTLEYNDDSEEIQIEGSKVDVVKRILEYGITARDEEGKLRSFRLDDGIDLMVNLFKGMSGSAMRASMPEYIDNGK